MAKGKKRQSDLEKDMDWDDVQGFAEQMARQDGPGQYKRAYDAAVKAIKDGTLTEARRAEIIETPKPLSPNAAGEVTLNARRFHELNDRLASIRAQAVKDAEAGEPPSYKGK